MTSRGIRKTLCIESKYSRRSVVSTSSFLTLLRGCVLKSGNSAVRRDSDVKKVNMKIPQSEVGRCYFRLISQEGA